MRPNIIWVTLDSIRYDHTTLSGYRNTTPELQRIAERDQSASFDNCYSYSNWTFASTSSILTGKLPSYHTTGMGNGKLPDEIQTIPERFQKSKYETACITNNSHVHENTNLSRGFDKFSYINKSTLLDEIPLSLIAKHVLNIRKHSGGLTKDSRKHVITNLMNDQAKNWIREFDSSNERFFLYLHHNDTHHPYAPPLPYLNRFSEDLDMSGKEMRDISLRISKDIHRYIAEGCEFSEKEWRAFIAMYDGLLAYCDACVGNLFDWVQENTDRKTIFVVSSDHGELFGEKNLLAHMLVTDDAVSRVPLVINGLQGIENINRTDLIQHGDVMKALLSEAEASTEGISGFDPREKTREHAVTQRGGDRVKKKLDKIKDFNPQYNVDDYPEELLTTVRTSEYRFDSWESGERLCNSDDEEITDPDIETELQRLTNEILANEGSPVTENMEEMEIDEGMREQLKDLGYLVD